MPKTQGRTKTLALQRKEGKSKGYEWDSTERNYVKSSSTTPAAVQQSHESTEQAAPGIDDALKNILPLLKRRARYHSVETIQLLKNFIHDRDFIVILSGFLEQWMKSTEKYEKLIEQFKIKSPTKPPRDFALTVKINHIADDLVYRRVYNDLTSQMYFLGTAYRSSVTNEHVRKIIRADLENHLKNLGSANQP